MFNQKEDTHPANMNFYPNGMLDRDQRTILILPKSTATDTASTTNIQMLQQQQTQINKSKFQFDCSDCNQTDVDRNFNKRNFNVQPLKCDNCLNLNKFIKDKKHKFDKRFVRTFYKKFFNCLIVSVIVYIMSVSQTEAVPIRGFDQVDRKIFEACQEGANPSSQRMSKENLHQSLETIIQVCNRTLLPIKQLAETYIQIAWSKSTDQLHSEWKGRELKWLYPNKQGKLKKDFRSRIEEAHHKHMTTKSWDENNIVEFLKELYLRFQRISLGIDEVNRSINDRIRTISDITDQNKLKASQNLFQQIQTDIKQLLDEIRDTIVGMNDCPETEMQQAMAEMQQDDDLKHWVIYREYENLLDYSRELLRHILEKSRGGN